MPFTLPLGETAPSFTLAGVDGQVYSLEEFKRPYLVICFTCNHCPHVVGSLSRTRQLAEAWQLREVQFVCINSNSPNTYPEDAFANMVQLSEENPFPWPYLYDADQKVARAYGALRTPHFFVFDTERRLVYTGLQFDHPRQPESDAHDYVNAALEDLIAKRPCQVPLTNPIGCNVKWEGHPSLWMPPEACDLVGPDSAVEISS